MNNKTLLLSVFKDFDENKYPVVRAFKDFLKTSEGGNDVGLINLSMQLIYTLMKMGELEIKAEGFERIDREGVTFFKKEILDMKRKHDRALNGDVEISNICSAETDTAEG